jgi:carboxyl-terminal processing protease
MRARFTKWGLICVILLQVTSLKAQRFDKDMQKMQMAWQIISTFYVDTVHEDQLAEEAIVGMLKSLDPHSVYITADEVKATNEPLDGSFDGIGIEFNILNDTLMVVSPISGGPSEKVGIQAGDRIVSIDDENVAGVGLKNSDVFKRLRGEKGTEVQLLIRRRGHSDNLNFTVERDKIPIHSVEAAYMANPEIGYIKVSRFAATTHDEFVVALKSLKKEGMEKLILDLRGNGGGYLKAAIDIADELLEGRKLMVYTEGLTSPKREHYSKGNGLFENGNLVIMIDEGAASASEIVAGAVQDWDRGLIIGRRSFGKGLVQRPFSLPDGSMMRLTIAKYYTPSGRCIQKDYADGIDAYQTEIYERYENGELYARENATAKDTSIFNTMVSGRTVYGGGGIMPDVHIPADTSMYSDYYRDLVASGVFNRFVLNYVDAHRKKLLRTYPQFNRFKQEFHVDEKLVELLVEEGVKNEIPRNEAGLEKSGQLLTTQLKALIARDLWTSSEYFEIVNPLTKDYGKALELINGGPAYSQILK